MTLKSFVDVLFILLLGTIVLLTQSVRLGALDTDLLKVGGGGVSPVRVDEVEVVVVAADALTHDGEPVGGVDELVERIEPGGMVLLVVADQELRHQRVLSVWADLRQRGFDVNLGVETVAEPEPAGVQPGG